jgi:hypothetical protein
VVVPLAGVAVMLVPYWATFQPGQPSPYSALPWLFPLLVAAGVVYAIVLQSTRPHLAKQAGSIVMGEYLSSERSESDLLEALDFERAEKAPR